ncbi:MAG: ComEC/Rec2 family competence protein, partial [Thermoleophilaceae bacterium]
ELVSGAGAGARVLARGSLGFRWAAGGRVGETLAVTGSLRRPRRSPQASFDFPALLARRGIFRELHLDSAHALARRGGTAGALDGARTRAERAISSGLDPPRAALARGMVLGQDEAIAPEVVDDFRRSGLAHLLAVSGQNVMLLTVLALPLLAFLGAGRRARLIALLVLIALYVPLAGAGPSLQRAAVMGAAGLVAVFASRPASRSYALLLAAAVTLALNPRAAGEPGWQLSFAAVGGIVWLAPPLRRSLGGWPRPLAEGFALTVVATVTTAPLLAHHFAQVSLVALPANLLALPVVAPVMWIGMLQSALGQLALAADPVPAVASAGGSALGAIASPLLGYLAGIARRGADLTAATVPVPKIGAGAVLGAYVAVGGAILVGRALARRIEPRATSARAGWRRLPLRHRGLALAILAATLVLAVARLTAPPPAPDRLTVSFLDVGQGDATLIQDRRGTAVLFDGGPPEARVARLLRAAGVKRLAVVVATHASRDHHGGLADVLERFPVELLLDGGDGNPDPEFRRAIDTARRRGVRRIAALAPLRLHAGELEIELISPPPRPPGPAPEDPNPRAAIAVVRAGAFELLLSADAESEALTPLALPDVDAIKVPHHGSSDPGLPGVLGRLRPQVAGIEVGEDNGYGHPTASTLAALKAAHVATYRTDRDGTVRLTLDDSEIRVESDR